MSGPQKVDDPGLAAGWQALYDPGSGLKYYWNPSTNVTTYQRPAGSGPEAGGGGGGSSYDSYNRVSSVQGTG
jgi:ATP-dependent RNA helicase DDX5/DBP2